jgi:hypothetical protein
MATKTAKKPAKTKKVEIDLKLGKETTPIEIDIHEIVSNLSQTRGMGALANLREMGYDIFETVKGHKDKQPIWEMLLSNDRAVRQKIIDLIDANEFDFTRFADLMVPGQAQPIRVQKVEGGKYDVIAGMMRALAIAFNWSRGQQIIDPPEGHVPATTKVRAELQESNCTEAELLLIGLCTNEHNEESPIDRAITFQRLKKCGMTPEEIGNLVCFTPQHINNHLRLLDPLLDKERMDIHTGRMGFDSALKLLQLRKEHGPDARPQPKVDGKAKFPKPDQLEKWYTSDKKPPKMKDKEWELWCHPVVRELMALRFKIKTAEASSNGDGSHDTKEDKENKTPLVKVMKSQAVKLLEAVGCEDAKRWDAAELKGKLENLPNTAGEKVPTDTKIKTLFDKLMHNYQQGGTVLIVGK